MAGRGTDIQLGGNLDFAKSNLKNFDDTIHLEEKINLILLTRKTV